MSKKFDQERCPMCPDGTWIPYCDGVHEITHKRKTRKLSCLHYCVCNVCGTRGFTEEQAEENQRLIADFENQLKDYISPKNIRRIRQKYRITQAQAAEIFQCGDAYFSKWERGEISPSGPTAVLLKNAFAHADFMQRLADAAGVNISVPPMASKKPAETKEPSLGTDQIHKMIANIISQDRAAEAAVLINRVQTRHTSSPTEGAWEGVFSNLEQYQEHGLPIPTMLAHTSSHRRGKGLVSMRRQK